MKVGPMKRQDTTNSSEWKPEMESTTSTTVIEELEPEQELSHEHRTVLNKLKDELTMWSDRVVEDFMNDPSNDYKIEYNWEFFNK